MSARPGLVGSLARHSGRLVRHLSSLARLLGLALGCGGGLRKAARSLLHRAGLLAGARRATALPEQEPGTVLFNRLWPLALLAVVAGALGFFFPPVPAVAVGYALLVALLWRKQSAAVEAIEGRDGVEFWIDRSSAFGPPQLVRVPGLRKIEPEEPAVPLGG